MNSIALKKNLINLVRNDKELLLRALKIARNEDNAVADLEIENTAAFKEDNSLKNSVRGLLDDELAYVRSVQANANDLLDINDQQSFISTISSTKVSQTKLPFHTDIISMTDDKHLAPSYSQNTAPLTFSGSVSDKMNFKEQQSIVSNSKQSRTEMPLQNDSIHEKGSQADEKQLTTSYSLRNNRSISRGSDINERQSLSSDKERRTKSLQIDFISHDHDVFPSENLKSKSK